MLPLAGAIELIHTYSLIHDDLPAMDDDALRRGQPTCHVKFGEDVAILAGGRAVRGGVPATCCSNRRSPPERVLVAAAELAAATGVNGMVGGQYADVSPHTPSGPEALRRLHELKTGRLIGASVLCVLLLGGIGWTCDNAVSSFRRRAGCAVPDRRRHPRRDRHRRCARQAARQRRASRQAHICERVRNGSCQGAGGGVAQDGAGGARESGERRAGRVKRGGGALSIPPKYAVSNVVGYIKGKSAIHLARTYSERKRNFVEQSFWARGYFVSTVGRDEKAIREYIQNQEKEDQRLEQLNLWK